MRNLPLIVGFGGVNSAGRASGHRAYQRMVFDALPSKHQQDTLRSLAHLMGVPVPVADSSFSEAQQAQILSNTLIRKIHKGLYDPQSVPAQKKSQPAHGWGKY